MSRLTEAKIRGMVKAEIEKDGWITWCPSKSRFQQNDIWGVFDLIAVKSFGEGDWKLRFIQYTTLGHISERQKKVGEFLLKNELVDFPAEVWGYDKKNKKFKKVIVKWDLI